MCDGAADLVQAVRLFRLFAADVFQVADDRFRRDHVARQPNLVSDTFDDMSVHVIGIGIWVCVV